LTEVKMNKILIFLMCLALVGCTAYQPGITENLIANSTNDTPIIDLNNTITNDTEVINNTTEVRVIPQFRDVDYSIKGNQLILSGALFDAASNEPMDGATIKILCANVIQYNVVVEDGSFSIVLERDKCQPGDKTWAEIYFEGTTYRSATMIIPGLETSGGSSGGGGGGGGSSGGSSGSSLSPTPEASESPSPEATPTPEASESPSPEATSTPTPEDTPEETPTQEPQSGEPCTDENPCTVIIIPAGD
jgi:hypothetical protein